MTPEAAHEPRSFNFCAKRRSRTSASPGSTTTGHLRQGFPEVVFGQGKTPTRSPRSPSASSPPATPCWSPEPTRDAFEAVSAESARRDLPRTGPDVSPRPHAAARPARGIDPDRRRRHRRPAGRRGSRGHGRDHGQHRSTGCTTSGSPDSTASWPNTHRLIAARVIIVVAGMEGALPERGRRPGRRAGHRRPDQRRLRRQLRRPDRPARRC